MRALFGEFCLKLVGLSIPKSETVIGPTNMGDALPDGEKRTPLSIHLESGVSKFLMVYSKRRGKLLL
jgi:hypothetical protein